MTSSLDPRIARWFGDDERPELSWQLLHPLDQAEVIKIAVAEGEDPGFLTALQFKALPADQRRRRTLALERWSEAVPYVRTGQLRRIEREIESLPAPRPDEDRGLLDVPLVTGPPGSGKTFFLKRARIRALCACAWDRRLALEDEPKLSDELIISRWRPVLWRSMDGNLRPAKFFALLCRELGAPAGDDPQRSFEAAVHRHGVQWLFLDEMQMVNFDGQYGRYLQDAIKALQNMGVRLVLCGHNMRQMLGRQRTSAQVAAREQLVARASFLEISRYRHDDPDSINEWKRYLRQLEGRLRLTGHQPGEPVLSEQLEEYLWVSTLGYANALASLLTKGTKAAALSPGQRLSERLLDDVTLNERVQPGRKRRLAQWRQHTFGWDTDVLPGT